MPLLKILVWMTIGTALFMAFRAALKDTINQSKDPNASKGPDGGGPPSGTEIGFDADGDGGGDGGD
jgi:hypothetical protein